MGHRFVDQIVIRQRMDDKDARMAKELRQRQWATVTTIGTRLRNRRASLPDVGPETPVVDVAIVPVPDQPVGPVVDVTLVPVPKDQQ